MPLISVIIPVYNGERTIYDAVTSVLNQSFEEFELLVINDGSQDSTLDILAEIKDPRLKIHSFPNEGLSASRNRGIRRASGEYVSFLDADDMWTPDKLESQLAALRGQPDAAVCYSWTDFIDQEGNPLGYGIHTTRNGHVFPDLLKFYFVGSGSNALIRKTAFDAVGLFDESLKSVEDWDMFLRLATTYQFAAVPQAQILYRIVDDSLSSDVLRMEREMLKVVDRAYAQEPGKSLSHLKKYTLANLYLYLASRALKGTSSRQHGILAGRFMWRAYLQNPQILKQVSYVLTLLFKMGSVILLPPKLARAARASAKSLGRRVSRSVVDMRSR